MPQLASANQFLYGNVAVPSYSQRRPVTAERLSHEKAGIIEDAQGNQLTFIGRLNRLAQLYPY